MGLNSGFKGLSSALPMLTNHVAAYYWSRLSCRNRVVWRRVTCLPSFRMMESKTLALRYYSIPKKKLPKTEILL